jgi:hypothetical protein
MTEYMQWLEQHFGLLFAVGGKSSFLRSSHEEHALRERQRQRKYQCPKSMY